MTTCFDVFRQCAAAIANGDLIQGVSAKDKEYHFQNWFEQRLNQLQIQCDDTKRNAYPDFCLVNNPEGYEIKALAWPGRKRNYDSNSQLPSGKHKGRTIFYVFGRYPKDLTPYPDQGGGRRHYPVIDLIVCHGDFLNANTEYRHKNKNVKGFGTYGDIMIRDRKMYVAPTPFALAANTTGLKTLIIPEDFAEAPEGFIEVGRLTRVEAERLVVGYKFNLETNQITADYRPNPNAGEEHRFIAYRVAGDSTRQVTMETGDAAPDMFPDDEEE